MIASPNIIFILADDMGYGDLAANNPDSRIPTPNLDRLAASGIRFSDAHAASAVCTPSRYNVLTGSYCWRSRLKQGITWEYDGALIEPDRQTVAHLLKAQGYATACIGKWHLGLDWSTRDGRHPNETLPFGKYANEARHAFHDQVDFAGGIGGGPVDRGFDHYFGVDVPNFPPYTWFEDDHLAPLPNGEKPEGMYGHPGPALEGWQLEAMIPEFTRRAVDWIERHAQARQPHFLYFPLTSPHSPIVPNVPFKGRSQAGHYGDFVCEVDWVVGAILDALERTGTADNTLLVFTSDNGPEHGTRDDPGAWERIREFGHYSMGPLRGIKRDTWEGGHRVPFLARWPEVTPAGVACDQLVQLGDFMATCSEITGGAIQPGQAEDSISFLPLLQGNLNQPTRMQAVLHGAHGTFALRRGPWVYIDAPTGCDKGNQEPAWFRQQRGVLDHDQPAELFNLAEDLAERSNRFAGEPALATELKATLEAEKGDDA